MKETVTFSNTLTMSVLPEKKPKQRNTDSEFMLNPGQSPIPVPNKNGYGSPALKLDFAEILSRISTQESIIDPSSHVNQFPKQEFKIETDDSVVSDGNGGDVNLKKEIFDDDAD